MADRQVPRPGIVSADEHEALAQVICLAPQGVDLCLPQFRFSGLFQIQHGPGY